MRIKKQILLIILLVSYSINSLAVQTYNSATSEIEATNQDGRVTSHTTKMGETAYSIATSYKTTVEQLYKLNPGIENGINVGQVLKVPMATSTSYTSYDSYKNTYKIEAKDTLYSLAKKYNTTVQEIIKANPSLSEETFSIGREIIIPTAQTIATTPIVTSEFSADSFSDHEHKVEKQETLYSISKKYNSTVEAIIEANPSIRETGLREGSVIYVPKQKDRSYSSLSTFGEQDGNFPSHFIPQDNIIRVALLLPFISGSKSVAQEKITEYYEGFLLAIQRMKEKGLNAEIYTFDIGTDGDSRRLESILGTHELNNLNLIIGGVSEKQVQLISRFSQRTGIKYVAPFSQKVPGIENNKNLFQVAGSHSAQFPKIANAFASQFRNANIIFLTESGSDKNKMSFVKVLQSTLQEANIPYRTTNTSASIIDDLKAVIDRSRKNIIIPTSSSEASLKRVLEAEEVLTRAKNDISLFGYPEWQTYINKTKKLHKADSYLYSMFYLDNNNPEAQLFSDRYKKWYNKSLVVSYPKFAHMGYDTGIVFLAALQKLGQDFSPRITELNTPTLQSALYFQPVSAKGGYQNTGMYFVHLKPDETIEKTEINK